MQYNLEKPTLTLFPKLNTAENASALEASSYPQIVISALNSLRDTNLLTGKSAQENFKTLIDAGAHSLAVASVLRVLKDTNLLTSEKAQENRKALIDAGAYARAVANALIALKGTNLLITGESAQENFKALVEASAHAQTVANAFYYLKDTNLLTGERAQKNFKNLIAAGAHAKEWAGLLQIPFTVENYNKIATKVSELPLPAIYFALLQYRDRELFSLILSKLTPAQKTGFLFLVATKTEDLAEGIYAELLEVGQMSLFLRHEMHSLPSYLRDTLDQCAEGKEKRVLQQRLERLEEKQQALIEQNRTTAMFGFVLPEITLRRLPRAEDSNDFDELAEDISHLLPQGPIQQAVQDLKALAVAFKVDKDLLALMNHLRSAIKTYQAETPPDKRAYPYWQEELLAVRKLCLAGKKNALSNLMMSLREPLVSHLSHLLNTRSAALLSQKLATLDSEEVHYPAAVVGAYLGIDRRDQEADPYAFFLTDETLRTMARVIASALNRKDLIEVARPKIPPYFLERLGKEVDILSAVFQKNLREFISNVKEAGLSEALGLTPVNENEHALCLLANISDAAEESRISEAFLGNIALPPMTIRPDLAIQLATQTENLLLAKGLLKELSEVKRQIKTFLLKQEADISEEDYPWLEELLTKLDGSALVLEVLADLSPQEFARLKIAPFIHQPPGSNRSLLQELAINPYYAEALFKRRFLAQGQVMANGPRTTSVETQAMAEGESAPQADRLQVLFAKFQADSKTQLEAFYERLYTQPGSLCFALLQLTSEADRAPLARILMTHLAEQEELFRTCDSITQLMIAYLTKKMPLANLPVFFSPKHPDYVRVQSFLTQHLKCLLQDNQLKDYFKIISGLPPKLVREEAYLRSELLKTKGPLIAEQLADLEPYLEKLGTEGTKFRESLSHPLGLRP